MDFFIFVCSRCQRAGWVKLPTVNESLLECCNCCIFLSICLNIHNGDFFGNEVSFVHQVFLLYGYTIFAVSNKVGHKYYSHLVWKRRMLLILNQFYHKVTTRWPDFNLCCYMDGEISLHPLLSWELCVKVLFCKGVSQILQPSTRNLDVDAMWKGLCKESHTLINLIFLSNV
jgi:hypothetical protein